MFMHVLRAAFGCTSSSNHSCSSRCPNPKGYTLSPDMLIYQSLSCMVHCCNLSSTCMKLQKQPRYPVLLRFLFPVQVFPLRPYIQQRTAIMFTSYRTACMHFIRSWLVEANCVLALMAEAVNFPASNAEIPLPLERACCLFGVG